MAFLLCFAHPSHREILQFHFSPASLCVCVSARACVCTVVYNILDQYYNNANNNIMHVVRFYAAPGPFATVISIDTTTAAEALLPQ